MRKTTILLILFVLSLMITASCNRKEGRVIDSPTVTSANSQDKASEEKAVSRERRDIAEVQSFRYIEERLKESGLKRLNYEELSGTSKEIRIWDSDSFKLYCLILKEVNGEWKGLYLPHIEQDSKQSKEPLPLPPPKDGWETLLVKLESLGIYTIPDAEDVGANEYGFDVGGLMGEIKTSNSYRNYMYMGYRSSIKPEAKKVAAIVDTLLDQFKLKPLD